MFSASTTLHGKSMLACKPHAIFFLASFLVLRCLPSQIRAWVHTCLEYYPFFASSFFPSFPIPFSLNSHQEGIRGDVTSLHSFLGGSVGGGRGFGLARHFLKSGEKWEKRVESSMQRKGDELRKGDTDFDLQEKGLSSTHTI